MCIGLTVLSGCWSSDQLSDLAIVSALAIDLNEEGQYLGTLQIINPGNIPGSLQGGVAGTSPTVTVYTATGDNLVEMDNRITSKISRRPFFAHTSLLIISEELAREEGISLILDALERGLEFRNTTRVVIARDTKAGDLAKVLTSVDKVPAENIRNLLESAELINGSTLNVNLQEVIKSLVTKGKEPLIGGASILGDKEKGGGMENLQSAKPDTVLEANGMAVFKEGKLIDWLDGEKARGTLWILDGVQTTTVNAEWENEEEALAYYVIREKTNISAEMREGKPTISINVRAEGDIRSVNVPIELTNPHVVLEVEKAFEKEIKEEIEAAIEVSQENKTDVLGFGEVVSRSHPKEWKVLEQKWNDRSFPELEVEVIVDAFIRRTGMRNNPHFIENAD